MNKHTPGPWSFRPRFVEEDGSVSPAHIANADEHFVCAVEAAAVAEIAVKEPGSFWDKSPVREANARLIAAAPELLAELEMLSNIVEGCGLATMPEVECRIAFARAAIAKATGQSA